MTPDNRQPRKLRRRRRRPAGAMASQPSQGNGPIMQGQPNPSSDQQPGEGQPPYPPGGGGGRRRRRSRHRRRGGGGGPMAQEGTAPPMEMPSGELLPSSGVLYIKPNGSGLLVKSSNNYVPE